MSVNTGSFFQKKSSDGVFGHYGIVELPNDGNYSKAVEHGFSAGYFEPGIYSFTLTPVDYFSRSGKALKGEFTVKKVPWTEIRNKSAITVFTRKKGGTEIKPDAQGYYFMTGDSRLIIPSEVISQAVAAKKKLIVAVRMSCGGKGKSSAIRIISISGQIVTQRAGCFRESDQVQQYSQVFRPKKQEYSLLFRNNGPVKYRFEQIRYFLY